MRDCLKWKSLLMNFLLGLVAFIFLIGCLEILLRKFHFFGARISWAKPDPLIGYRFVPGAYYWFFQENDHPIQGRINNFGWRDVEWELAKSPDVYRIAVLGDSYVEAFQVELEKTFLKLTEKELRRKLGIKVELMNFGRSGATQSEELIILEKDVLKFSPDLVILFFDPQNDITDISPLTAPNNLRPFFKISKKGKLILDTSFTRRKEFILKEKIYWFKRHSALISLLCEKYNLIWKRKRYRKRELENSKRGMEGYLSLCTSHPDPLYLENYNLVKTLIKEMVNICKKKNIDFLLVCMDIPAYKWEVEEKIKYIDSSFDSNFFEKELENFSHSLGIHYLGLQSIFRKTYQKERKSLHWAHWNYLGHRIVAKALVGKLEGIIWESFNGKDRKYKREEKGILIPNIPQ